MNAALTSFPSEFLKPCLLHNGSTKASDESFQKAPKKAPEPKKWREANQWFRILNRDNRWFHRSIDTNNETIYLSSSHTLDDTVLRYAAKKLPQYHANFYEDIQKDLTNASLTYLLFTFVGPSEAPAKFVGFWAPDVPAEVSATRYEQVLPGYEGPKPSFIAVQFVGISRSKGFVKALGLATIEGKPDCHLRVGMGWWLEKEWENRKDEQFSGIIV